MASLADKMHKKEDEGKIIESTNVSGIINAANKVEEKDKNIQKQNNRKDSEELEKDLRNVKAELRAYKQKEEEELKRKAQQKKPGRKKKRTEEYQKLSLELPDSMCKEMSVAISYHKSMAGYIRHLIAKDLKENKEFYEKNQSMWE